MSSIAISKFDELQGERLQQYMEPLLVRDDVFLSREQFSHLCDRLHKYDHFHLVYALELCARCDVGVIAHLLPEFLLHSEGSVVCAALNILESIPADALSVELVRRLEAVTVVPRWEHKLKTLCGKLNDRLLTNR